MLGEIAKPLQETLFNGFSTNENTIEHHLSMLLLKVTGKAYRDEAPIWEDDPFPVRFPVKVLIALRPETAVPIIEMRDRLSIFKDLANPHAWTGRLRGSPAKWTKADGLAVVKALEQAKAEPVERPLDHLKLKRRSPFFRSSDDSFVSIPDNEIEALSSGPPAEEVRPAQVGDETSAHLHIQCFLRSSEMTWD